MPELVQPAGSMLPREVFDFHNNLVYSEQECLLLDISYLIVWQWALRTYIMAANTWSVSRPKFEIESHWKRLRGIKIYALARLYPCPRPLVVIALLIMSLLRAQTALAADINVTDDCDIYDAVTAANNNNNSHNSDCTRGSGDDTIILPTGGGTTTLTSTLLLTSNITIEGNGHTLSGDGQWRVINAQRHLAINNLTIREGKVGLNEHGAGILSTKVSQGSTD